MIISPSDTRQHVQNAGLQSRSIFHNHKYRTVSTYNCGSGIRLSISRPDAQLLAAIAEFREALTPEQRGQFQAHQSTPEPNDVFKLMAVIDGLMQSKQVAVRNVSAHVCTQSLIPYTTLALSWTLLYLRTQQSRLWYGEASNLRYW